MAVNRMGFQKLLMLGCWITVSSLGVFTTEVKAIDIIGVTEINRTIDAGVDSVNFLLAPSSFDTLTVLSSSQIFQDIPGTISAGNASFMSTGDILLSSFNDFDLVSATGRSITLVDIDGISIDSLVGTDSVTLTAGGPLTFTTTGGGLTASRATLSAPTIGFNSLLTLDLSQPPTNALVDLSANSISFGGNLHINAAFAPQLMDGNMFTIFNFVGNTPTITGQFSNIFLPTLSSGLMWDTSALLTTGGLSVVGGNAPTIPEPSTMLLFGTGLAGLFGWQYQKKQLK